MNIANIELAVRRICQEIYPSIRESWWLSATEAKLIYELVVCILGSQVPYEIALAAAEEIRDAGLLENPTERYCAPVYEKAIYDVLRQPLHGPGWAPAGRRYRFARMRANHISRTVWAIYSDGGSLKGRLEACTSAREARRSIVEIGVGIGPKQASLFLRNIGFTDELAILDTHLLRFMGLFGLRDQTTRAISSMQSYETHENHLRYYAKSIGYPLGCVDQAVWIVMRVYQQEVRSSYQITDFSSPNLNKSLDKEMEKVYIIDEIGEDFVVVNGERIEVDPPFETLPDKQEYETWLNEVMADAIETIGSDTEISTLQDHFASVVKGWKTD